MKPFCLCLDLDGFYVNNKFVVREIGWYAPLLNNHEAFGVQHFTHDYTWDMLSKKDQRTVAYVKRNVTGMTFRPSPAEFLLQDTSTLPGQDHVPVYVEHLWTHFKTSDCNKVAYKGGTVEFVLLTLLGIPSLDLEPLGCPTFNTLCVDDDYPSCHCHCHKRSKAHCSMSECYLFSKWFLKNKQG